MRPILEYACVVWSPYLKNNTNKLEITQQRAARFSINNYDNYASVTNMLKYLGWPTLEQRCKELRILMLFKIMNQLVELLSGGLLIPIQEGTRRNFGSFKQE